MNFKKHPLFWLISPLALALDHLAKLWTIQNFELNETRPVWENVFHFTYVRNYGAAFSLFSENGEWLRWLSLIVSLGLMALALYGPKMNRWEQAGYGLILGGALGNGVDRFVAGYVVDFLDFRLIRFPVFNLADVAINLGIICLLIATTFPEPKRQKKN
ncbi:signal peptidase II [Roseofilum casamattae]|uniref:Lipoprotein signal peptidase n=1 Tax=Roseofilum casamattae BLCC-M143 TaxID=3022442 RepID=A0ABT7BVH1_9CYAN|nr:signal peptidase II [Roseofilum casamattae]MDJ1183181.1 signal peptidase II [Roseofilum casamattae BLCC-M143]